VSTTQPVTALAYISTADSGEERGSVLVVDQDGLELDKIDLGEYGYLFEALNELRDRGWRVYEDAVHRWADTTGRGYYQTPIYRD